MGVQNDYSVCILLIGYQQSEQLFGYSLLALVLWEYIFLSISYTYHYLRQKVMFSPLVVCGFVCLLVIHVLQENARKEVHKNFRIDRTWYKEQSGTLWKVSFKPFRKIIFLFFGGNPCLLATLWQNGFPWNFQDRSDIRNETIWNIYDRDIAFNSLVQDSFLYFLDLCLLATLWMVNGFSWNFQNMFDMTQRTIGWTVHALQTRCGRGLPSCSASCCYF